MAGLVLITLVLAPSAVVVASIRPTSPIIEGIARLWAGTILWAARVSYQVDGVEHFAPAASYVVVSNHISNLDPMLHFLAVPLPVRFLAKKELFRIPIFGSALRAIGIVETDRQAGAGAHSAINRQVEEVVSRGHSLVIYAEGTRSRDGRMRRFKKGAFYLAIRAGVPVVPCAVDGTQEAWRPGDWILRGGHARVVFYEPIPTAELSPADANRLRDQVEETVRAGHQALRAG